MSTTTNIIIGLIISAIGYSIINASVIGNFVMLIGGCMILSELWVFVIEANNHKLDEKNK